MKINVIGLGYIGLPTALIFASNGFEVIGSDIKEETIKKLNSGAVTFEEKGLSELYQSAVCNNIVFSNKIEDADLYIVAVATPYDCETKKIDATYVKNAVKDTLKVCKRGSIIVIESTISPGTIENDILPLVNDTNLILNKDIFFAHAPERIIPGNMIYELSHNSRTIGADIPEIADKVASVYSKITLGEVVKCSIKAAEMTKVVENTYRAVNIAFANELLKICDAANLDVYEVIKICNMHPRVKILNPGPGVGGHCISVDPWFLVGDYPQLAKVITASMETNAHMPEYVLSKLHEIMVENGVNDLNKIGLYGLTYKENVDDYRESPTLQLIDYQINHLGTPLKSFDPLLNKQIVNNQIMDFDSFIKDLEIIVIMVKHDHIINNCDFLKGKIVLDTQNCLPNLDYLKKYKL